MKKIRTIYQNMRDSVRAVTNIDIPDFFNKLIYFVLFRFSLVLGYLLRSVEEQESLWGGGGGGGELFLAPVQRIGHTTMQPLWFPL